MWQLTFLYHITMFSAGKVIKQDGLRKLQFKTNKRTDFIYTEKLHKNTNIMLEKNYTEHLTKNVIDLYYNTVFTFCCPKGNN